MIEKICIAQHKGHFWPHSIILCHPYIFPSFCSGWTYRPDFQSPLNDTPLIIKFSFGMSNIYSNVKLIANFCTLYIKGSASYQCSFVTKMKSTYDGFLCPQFMYPTWLHCTNPILCAWNKPWLCFDTESTLLWFLLTSFKFEIATNFPFGHTASILKTSCTQDKMSPTPIMSWCCMFSRNMCHNQSLCLSFFYILYFQYIGTLDVPRPSSRVEIVAAMRRIRVSGWYY